MILFEIKLLNLPENHFLTNMDIPFVFGKIADGKDFTNRTDDTRRLTDNFRSLISTVIISPRRWGKTSLVNHALKSLKADKDYFVCNVDMFNCRTEAQFYQVYANAVLRASCTKIEEFIETAKKYVGSFGPKLSLSDNAMQYELSLGIEFKDRHYSYDEILNLPQKIANDRGRKFIICIDEFQNVASYDDSLGFQRKLRAHWQNHNKVGYCLFGSKRHMLMDIFNNYQMPFYKFGDIMFLEKICKSEWVSFIVERFRETGKEIGEDCAGLITEKVECHPYYVQQLAQLVWLRTDKVCDERVVEEAFFSLVGQLSLLFSNITDSLKPRQIGFLKAVAAGERNFTSGEVLRKYGLGTSANVKNLRKALLDKDIIDVNGDTTSVQDPVFAFWVMQNL